MPITSSPGAALAHARHPLSLLARLAKRECTVNLEIDAGGGRELRIHQGGVSSRKGARINYSEFADARDRGWLSDVDGDGLRWRLSQEGRSVLRRAKSAGDGAIAKEGGEGGKVVAAATSVASIDAAESPLGWLRRRRDKSGQPMITAVEFEAGERLRGDLWFAQMSPRVTVNWSAEGGSSRSGSGLGIDIRDNVSAAQQRVRRALSAVAPISGGLLLDVCGHLLGLEQVERARGWPPRSGKIALQMALGELARHYGMLGAEAAHGRLASRLRHWGVDDYRPHVEASGE